MALKQLTQPPPAYQSSRGRLFTLQVYQNTVYATKLHESMPVSLVAFKHRGDAHALGVMLEEHRRLFREWPDLSTGDSHVVLPSVAHKRRLDFLQIATWRQSDLEFSCQSNCLNLFILTHMRPTERGFAMQGVSLTMEPPVDFYRARFADLYNS